MSKTMTAALLVAALLVGPAWAKQKGQTQPPAPPPAPQQEQMQPAPPLPPQPGAQTSAVAGQWGCRFSYAELNQQGMQTSGFNREYVLLLYPQGNYEAQGTEAGASGYSQFYSQGQWQEAPGPQGSMIMAQGSYQSNQPYGIPGMMFSFNGQMQANGVLSLTYEQPDPYGQYVMNRSNTYCERQSG